MAIRPTIDITAFTDPTLGVNTGRTITNINTLDQFLSDVIACREDSADTLDPKQTISAFGLQPGSTIRLSPDGQSLLSPEIVPAFADGGYCIIDKLFYDSNALARQRYGLGDSDLVVGAEGDFRYIGTFNADYTESSQTYNFPSPLYPFAKPCRIRGIARVGGLYVRLQHYDSRGLPLNDQHSRFEIRSTGTGATAYNLTPQRFNDEEQTDFTVENIETAVQVAADGDFNESILVFETLLEVVPLTDEDLVLDGDLGSRLNKLRITTVFGSYATLAEAYADTRPGNAFACLDPTHPNYIAELVYEGATYGAIGEPFDGSEGYTIPTITANRLYYSEILTGSRCNDVNNFIPSELPNLQQLPNPDQG